MTSFMGTILLRRPFALGQAELILQIARYEGLSSSAECLRRVYTAFGGGGVQLLKDKGTHRADRLMQMYEKKLTHSGHTTKFSVSEGGEGWEVRVEQDSRLIRRASYTDWHRVERAVSQMRIEADELEQSGWREPVER
jgi:hypothetical protein